MKRTLISALWCAATLAFSGSAAFAQTLTLLNPPNSGYTEGGVYTTPYNISVNSTPMQLICDDFTTDISIGESWTTTATTLSTVDAATVTGLKFDQSMYNSSILGGTGDVVQDYAVAAVLAGELLALPNTDSANAGALSFAIWDVFDSTLLGTSYAGMSDPYGTITQAQWAAAMTDLTSAIATVDGVLTGGSNSSSVTLNGQTVKLWSGGVVSLNSLGINSLTAYTPSPNAGVAQEFLSVSTPEASTPILLVVDLAGVLGLIGFLKRRQAKRSC
jgi:hypothetical protein